MELASRARIPPRPPLPQSAEAGDVVESVAVAGEKDEFRAAGSRFSPKLPLAFLGLGERIESSLRLLTRRVDEVDDVPLQIVVTSMNGGDLLKHEVIC